MPPDQGTFLSTPIVVEWSRGACEDAKMADDQDWLKLQVGGPGKPVDADAFVSIFQHTIAALKAIDRGFSTYGGETIQWEIVDAGSNSPIYATIQGRGPSPACTRDTGERCEHSCFGDCPVESGQCVSDRLWKGQSQVRGEDRFGRQAASPEAHLFDPRVETRITRVVAVNANQARRALEMGKSRLVEHGTIEGRLRDLSESYSHDKLGIVDRLTGEVTQCYLRDESLEPAVLKGWKHRVAVTGDITVDRQSGRPVRVMVDDIRILRDRGDLPQIEHLRGIDITNGMEPSEYIRGLRDAE